jgi:serine phosphatase RsbU (regulator of sigma subunit)
VVGETLGTGLRASLASAQVRSFCHVLGTADPMPGPGELLEALNRALHRDSRGDRGLRAACFAAVIDGVKGRVAFAAAGGTTPYHLVRAERSLGVLRARGPLLGELPDAQYPTKEQALGAGDALVFVTSGVPEALDSNRSPFGDRRLQKVLMVAPGQEPRATRDALLRALDTHRAEAPPLADESILVLQVG